MKRIFAVILLSIFAVSMFALPVCAKSPVPSVYVTIADENGEIVLASQEVQIIEANAMTIDGVLRIAHEEFFDGENGYASEETLYGRSMVRLWGVENGGSYGYYVNNASPASLLDEVKRGDHIYAYVYTDTVGFTDTYSYFEHNILYKLNRGDEIILTLMQLSFDENWMPVSLPVNGAAITVNGKATDFITDENGRATVILNNAGELLISAEKEGVNLVPPVCVASVDGISNAMIYTMLGITAAVIVLAIGAVFAVVIYTRKVAWKDEK